MNHHALLGNHSLRRISSFILCLATVCVGVATSVAQESKKPKKLEEGFRWLFDGKTLEGWEGEKDYFRVEDGSIVAGTLEKKIPHNQFLCTKKRYENFELILEAKLRGEGNNAGVQFRSERVKDSHEVSGYQCDVGVAFKRPVWGSLYDESRRRKMLAEGPVEEVKKCFKEGQWNELKIVARGDRIQLFLNGHPTVDYKETDQGIARSGVFGLQIHSGPPTEALYRHIRIREW